MFNPAEAAGTPSFSCKRINRDTCADAQLCRDIKLNHQLNHKTES